MKTSCITAGICLTLGALSLTAPVFAHGPEGHGKMRMDAQMKKLHAMMPMFSLASAQLEAALEKGDTPAADAEAGRILAAIPDLKQSKPHKNLKQRKKFLKLATELDQAVLSTRELAKNGDFVAAKTAFQKVEAACAACHATFR